MPIDIVETLVSMRSGQVVIDLNKKFSELITAVKDTGGKEIGRASCRERVCT